MASVAHPTDREKPDRLSGVLNPDQLIRPRSAETIKASGHVNRTRKAGHMTASDQCSSRQKALASWGPSTHEAASFIQIDPDVPDVRTWEYASAQRLGRHPRPVQLVH